MGGIIQTAQSYSLQVRVDRWLQLKQAAGSVTYYRGGGSQSAQIGQRLQSVGDAVATGWQSSAILEVDTGVGFIQMTENTLLRVQSLEMAPDNGRITRLQVSGGQVQLKIRRFTHGGSRLEIETPAGLTGVRGTEFGVGVQPNGKTGVATRSGSVMTVAKGRKVFVNRGFQNFTIPGEPPTPPVPLRNDTSLKAQFVKEISGNLRRLRLVGQVDPVNTVLVEGVPKSTDRNGRFSVPVPALTRVKVKVTVITPLGKRQIHEVEFS